MGSSQGLRRAGPADDFCRQRDGEHIGQGLNRARRREVGEGAARVIDIDLAGAGHGHPCPHHADALADAGTPVA
jgi:hypothetical protein